MADKRDTAAAAAGWNPSPFFSKENHEIQWMYPQLRMRVWAQRDGVHLYAYVERATHLGRLVQNEIARAVWQPDGVTERQVVEWAKRALESYLAKEYSKEWNVTSED